MERLCQEAVCLNSHSFSGLSSTQLRSTSRLIQNFVGFCVYFLVFYFAFIFRRARSRDHGQLAYSVCFASPGGYAGAVEQAGLLVERDLAPPSPSQR